MNAEAEAQCASDRRILCSTVTCINLDSCKTQWDPIFGELVNHKMGVVHSWVGLYGVVWWSHDGMESIMHLPLMGRVFDLVFHSSVVTRCVGVPF